MPEIETDSLEDVGLCTVAEAAARKGKGVRAVQRWIEAGRLRPVALYVGVGRFRVVYLLRIKDVDAFEPRKPGAPAGNQFARKEQAPEPTKTRRSAKSGKKSRNP